MPDPVATPITPDPFSGLKRAWSLAKLVAILAAGAGATHLYHGGGSTVAKSGGPKSVIAGPTTAIPGELVSLDGSGSERADVYRWLVAPDQATGKELFQTFDGGRRARISTIPGVRKFTLLTSNATGIDIAEHVITIPPGGSPTPPGPAPVVPDNPRPGPVHPSPVVPVVPVVPTPDPTPLFPPGQFGLAAKTYLWATTKVVTPTRAAEAVMFADASESLAAALAAGTIRGITRYDLAMSVQKAIAERNAKLPPDVVTSWKGFAAAFNAEVNALFAAGRLTTTEEWAHLCREMSAGLRAVK